MTLFGHSRLTQIQLSYKSLQITSFEGLEGEKNIRENLTDSFLSNLCDVLARITTEIPYTFTRYLANLFLENRFVIRV